MDVEKNIGDPAFENNVKLSKSTFDFMMDKSYYRCFIGISIHWLGKISLCTAMFIIKCL